MADTKMPAQRRPLSERELDVLTLFAQGLNSVEAARKLWVTQNTVRSHLTRMRRATGAKSVAQLVHIAYQTGAFRVKEVPSA